MSYLLLFRVHLLNHLQISAKFDKAIELLKILNSYKCENWKLDKLKVGAQHLAGFVAYWQVNQYPCSAEPDMARHLLHSRKVGNMGRMKGWHDWDGHGDSME